MTSRFFATLLFCTLLFGLSGPAAIAQGGGENTKRAQTGFKFLSASLSPRVAGMGGAATTLQLKSTALFYNPAGMAQMDQYGHVSLGIMQWIAGIDYSHASAAIRPAGGTYGVIGVSVMQVDYGKLEGTRRADNQKGYVETGTFSPGSWAVGLGYAYPATDRISVGGQVKFAKQDLGTSVMSLEGATKSNELGTFAYDFGIQYDTAYRGIKVAMNVRNFSSEVTYEQQSFELPLALSVGVSTDVFKFTDRLPNPGDRHSFILSVKGVSPRDYSERMRFGGEYTFMDILSLRAGYTIPNAKIEQGFNLGAGVQAPVGGLGIRADYSYTSFEVFDGVHRIAVDIGF